MHLVPFAVFPKHFHSDFARRSSKTVYLRAFTMTVSSEKPRVVVTGFGPFRHYTDNPSSQLAEKLLEDAEAKELYELSCSTMTVAYDEVARCVGDIWNGPSKPDLVIHLGVHHKQRTVHIEQCSFGVGYQSCDVKGDVPADHKNPFYTSSETITSQLNCANLATAVFEAVGRPEFLVVKESFDPGRRVFIL
uniref:DUF2088 domain-containing protein n=1 Tax=Steinernema glaseri TaxID=37863 RepID=A0A1I7ZQI5_9BILA